MNPKFILRVKIIVKIFAFLIYCIISAWILTILKVSENFFRNLFRIFHIKTVNCEFEYLKLRRDLRELNKNLT